MHNYYWLVAHIFMHVTANYKHLLGPYSNVAIEGNSHIQTPKMHVNKQGQMHSHQNNRNQWLNGQSNLSWLMQSGPMEGRWGAIERICGKYNNVTRTPNTIYAFICISAEANYRSWFSTNPHIHCITFDNNPTTFKSFLLAWWNMLIVIWTI
jgi:hypothetical protein